MLLSLAQKISWTDCLNSGESLNILLFQNGIFWCLLFAPWVWVSRVMPVIAIIEPTVFFLKWDLGLPLIASFHKWGFKKNIKHFKTYNEILPTFYVIGSLAVLISSYLKKTIQPCQIREPEHMISIQNWSTETHFAAQANLISPSLITAPF